MCHAGPYCDKPRHFGQTPGYAAPEIMGGLCHRRDTRQICAVAADMWGLGCVSLFLFTGSNPFALEDSYRVEKDCALVVEAWVSNKAPVNKGLDCCASIASIPTADTSLCMLQKKTVNTVVCKQLSAFSSVKVH